MTVSLPYLWPRLTTCLTIRNVKTKADILAEPRRLDSTGTFNDIKGMEGPLRRFERGPGAREMRGVMIFGIRHDRIVRGRLYMEGRRLLGRRHRSGCRAHDSGCLAVYDCLRALAADTRQPQLVSVAAGRGGRVH
jgi:hypothetical protein